MTYSPRTIGIIIASFLSVVFIVTAVLISGPLPFHFQKVNAESTHDLLVSYAAKDTDSDGLPDWEEALYGTDPNNPHSVNQTVTDGDAVSQGLIKPKFATATSTAISADSLPGSTPGPETITDQFARTLFAQYLSTRGSTQPTNEEIQKFVLDGVAQLMADQKNTPAFNLGQVRSAGTGPGALIAYAAAAEGVFTRHEVASDNDIISDLSIATLKNDPKAIARISSTAKTYSSIARELMQLPVPSELIPAHVALANSLMSLSTSLQDLTTVNTDPVRSMLGISEYPDGVTAFTTALTTMYSVYRTEGVSIDKGNPGSHFYGTLVVAQPSTSP